MEIVWIDFNAYTISRNEITTLFGITTFKTKIERDANNSFPWNAWKNELDNIIEKLFQCTSQKELNFIGDAPNLLWNYLEQRMRSSKHIVFYTKINNTSDN